MRSLRERLCLITPHWPQYPDATGMIMGDFNICEPEEGRFNVWNQTFTDGDTGKAALFHSLFPRVLAIAQPDYTRRDSYINGFIRALSRIDRAFINIPMVEARDFHCYSHVFENLGKHHAAKTDYSGTPGQTHPELDAQTSRHLFLFKRLDDEHQYPADAFGALADFKIILEKHKGRLFANSHARHLTAWEPSC